MKKKLKEYPTWVCFLCGLHASNKRCFEVSCCHIGICGVCGKETSVTEPRDFFYPKFKGHKNGQ